MCIHCSVYDLALQQLLIKIEYTLQFFDKLRYGCRLYSKWSYQTLCRVLFNFVILKWIMNPVYISVCIIATWIGFTEILGY